MEDALTWLMGTAGVPASRAAAMIAMAAQRGSSYDCHWTDERTGVKTWLICAGHPELAARRARS